MPRLQRLLYCFKSTNGCPESGNCWIGFVCEFGIGAFVKHTVKSYLFLACKDNAYTLNEIDINDPDYGDNTHPGFSDSIVPRGYTWSLPKSFSHDEIQTAWNTGIAMLLEEAYLLTPLVGHIPVRFNAKGVKIEDNFGNIVSIDMNKFDKEQWTVSNPTVVAP